MRYANWDQPDFYPLHFQCSGKVFLRAAQNRTIDENFCTIERPNWELRHRQWKTKVKYVRFSSRRQSAKRLFITMRRKKRILRRWDDHKFRQKSTSLCLRTLLSLVSTLRLNVIFAMGKRAQGVTIRSILHLARFRDTKVVKFRISSEFAFAQRDIYGPRPPGINSWRFVPSYVRR